MVLFISPPRAFSRMLTGLHKQMAFCHYTYLSWILRQTNLHLLFGPSHKPRQVCNQAQKLDLIMRCFCNLTSTNHFFTEWLMPPRCHSRHLRGRLQRPVLLSRPGWARPVRTQRCLRSRFQSQHQTVAPRCCSGNISVPLICGRQIGLYSRQRSAIVSNFRERKKKTQYRPRNGKTWWFSGIILENKGERATWDLFLKSDGMYF